MIISVLIVTIFIIFAFLIILSILIPLFLLFVWRIKRGRLGIKIWLITSVALAIMVAIPIVLNQLVFHIKRRPYIKMLKSYVPAELQKEIPWHFFNDLGAYDTWKFALVYPYKVTMIDSTDFGFLKNFRGETPEIGGDLTHLTFDANFLVARVYYSDIWGEKESETFWIVFEFSSGKFEKFTTENQALAEANKRGFSGKQLLEDLNTHYDRFAGDIY